LADQDNIYVMTKPAHNEKAVGWAEELLEGVGLKLNIGKTHYWTRPGAPNESPGGLEWRGAKRDRNIQILKQSMPSLLTQREESDASVKEKAITRRRKLVQRVVELARAGLGTHPAFALLRASVPADASFIMRTHLLDVETCRIMDGMAIMAVEQLVGLGEWTTTKRGWATLPVSAGGLGPTPMEVVAPCAYVAAWGQGLACIAK